MAATVWPTKNVDL